LEVLTAIETLGPLSPIPVLPHPWDAVADKVGCGNGNHLLSSHEVPKVINILQVTGDAQLTCMKQVPSRELESVVINTTAFLPIADGITRFSDAEQRAAAGNFLHVPLLGGSNKNEADLLVVAMELLLTGVVVPEVTEALADAMTE
ncbi:hypothetical protein C0992_011253, partial [Termitomyces sp. T32_za158]